MKLFSGLILLPLLFVPCYAQNPSNPSVFPTIAQMQALGVASKFYPAVKVLGYNTAGDLGGGIFMWSAASTATVDGCTIFTATGVSTGRWLRQNISSLSPVQCGAAGNGTTDDTTAVANFTTTLNSLAVVGTGLGRTYLIQYANTSPEFTRDGLSLSDITFLGKPGTSSSLDHGFIVISGPNISLSGVSVNGNMSNMTSSSQGATFCLLVNTTASRQRWNNVSVTNCNNTGVYFAIGGSPSYAVSTGHKIVNFTASGNAGTGLEVNGTTFSSISNCHVNSNGYGYQVSAPFPINRSNAAGTDQGFNSALRFEAHDIQITNCQFNDAGRDGLNFNQGTHDILVSNTEANYNGDGGFTGASDSTSPGTPGDGLSPWNIRLVNNFAKGNYGSGAAFFFPVAGLDITGGAYFNNNRVAGDLSSQSSFFNGVYVAAGSQQVSVKTAAYDDRQSATVTSSGTCSTTMSSWSPGTYLYYPKVAFYNASGAFQGYGVISAETSTSVTVSPTTVNGVTCASITTGWVITQRVQHNGAFLDNNVSGALDISGSGFLPGSAGNGVQGYNEFSGFLANGQNVTINGDPTSAVQLLSNPTMDANITGYTASTVTAGSDTTTADCESPGCMKLSGSPGFVSADTSSSGFIANAATYFATSAQWTCAKTNYFQSVPGQLTFIFYYVVSSTTFNFQAVTPQISGQWKPATVCGLVPATTTQLIFRVVYNTGGSNAFIDQNSVYTVQPKDNSSGVPITLPAILP